MVKLFIVMFAILWACSASAHSHDVTFDLSSPSDVISKLQQEGWIPVYGIPEPVIARVFAFCVRNYGTSPPIVLVRHPEKDGSWIVCKYPTMNEENANELCKAVFRNDQARVVRIDDLKVTCSRGVMT